MDDVKEIRNLLWSLVRELGELKAKHESLKEVVDSVRNTVERLEDSLNGKLDKKIATALDLQLASMAKRLYWIATSALITALISMIFRF